MTRMIFVKLLVLVLISFNLVFYVSPIQARTVDEIESEIKERQKELDDLNSKLKQAEEDLQASQSSVISSLSSIDSIKGELESIENELEVNRLKKLQLEESIKLKALEKEEKQKEQDEQITEVYISWKTTDVIQTLFGAEDILKNAVYQEFLSKRTEERILGLSTELNTLNKSNQEYKLGIELLEVDRVALDEKKKILERRIDELNSTIVTSQNSSSSIRSQIGAVQLEIEQLSEEQKAINAEDDQLTGGEQNGGTEEIIEGEIYFSGRGRDLYQGHGVGMSQFGAYGAAEKGWTAEDIVTFYYKNTKVKNRQGTVRVQGNTSNEGYVNRVMNLNEYVAGLGEVPDKACGNAEQAAENPDKYVKDNQSTIWDCWPEEAIKAQIIAARSYAGSYAGTICTSAACQVYKGGNAKQWAADETENQVIVSTGSTHTNQIIRALYSSDNSQGYGTANNDTIWSDFSGNGTAYSYLRHVNDSGIAKPYSYTNWTWRTNSYTIDEINQLFSYTAANYTTGGSNSFLKGVRNDVGQVTGLGFIRDGSNRVKKVKVIGTKGQRVLAGWLFKAIWNSWVYNKQPSGERDYIYSLTWFMKTGE